MSHRTRAELEASVDHVRRSPTDRGTLEMIVRRPATNEREVLEEGTLDLEQGLVGDNWHASASARAGENAINRDSQLTLMNTRFATVVAIDRQRWPLAGDQLYVDFDLSVENLPVGTQLEIGAAVVEITPELHRGCAKFKERYGIEALKFVNSPAGCELNLRGIYAKVVAPGTIRQGDQITRIES